MQKRPLGRTDLHVSKICLGTMTYGEQTEREDAFAQMDLALESGINFFDTAELYSIPPKRTTVGSTETIIGEWMKARGSRKNIILATKVVGRTDMNWFRQDGGKAELSRAQITEAVEGSLRRLQTDYLDLYQIHWPDRAVVGFGSNPTAYEPPAASPEHPIHETLEILAGLVRAGKIRHLGLSNESAWGVMKFLAESEARSLPRVVSVQNAYNLINRTYEVNLAEITMREQVGLLAYSPLAQGFLTGKYQNGAQPANSRTVLFNRGQRYQKPGAEIAIAAYLKLAQKHAIDPVHLANAFVTNRAFVTSNIIGATTLEQLNHIIAGAEVQISPELMAEINAVHQMHMNPAP